MAAEAVHRSRDPGALSRAVIFWLCADLVVALIGAFSEVVELRALAAMDGSAAISLGDPVPGASDLVGAAAGLGQLVTFLAAGFLSLKWIYRVSLNAHAISSGMQIKPAWAVGWYFVPIANLWKPFQALREAWQVSVEPHAWTSVPTPGLLRWWWGLWLVNGFLGNLSFRLALQAKTAQDLMASDVVILISDLLAVPLDLAFILVVRQLCALQLNALRGSVFA